MSSVRTPPNPFKVRAPCDSASQPALVAQHVELVLELPLQALDAVVFRVEMSQLAQLLLKCPK